jgi:dTDP-glucose 4,6-dehydratase
VFLTGGTGFFGAWLVESFLHINRRLNLGASMVVLTRDPDSARSRLPCLSDQPAVSLRQGDVRELEAHGGPFDYAIHAATESSHQQHAGDNRHMLETVVEGTRRVLAFAREGGARRFLLTRSGAVYGRQPHDRALLPEDFEGGPRSWDPMSAYAEGKRAAETLCAIEADQGPMSTRAARCFAFVGPHIPLNAHFAVGNFIRDALRGGPIRISGDGTAVRSYLYMADLAVWLWTLALSPNASGAYNVGSEGGVSILELAETVARIGAPGAMIELATPRSDGAQPNRYVPCTTRAQSELGLRQRISFDEAIGRTIDWLRQSSTNRQ